jgi:hypothetical protein
MLHGHEEPRELLRLERRTLEREDEQRVVDVGDGRIQQLRG